MPGVWGGKSEKRSGGGLPGREAGGEGKATEWTDAWSVSPLAVRLPLEHGAGGEPGTLLAG